MSSMVILKACFFPVSPFFVAVVKRKFRELKTADEEKALLEKSFSKSTDMSQIGFSIVAQNGRMQG